MSALLTGNRPAGDVDRPMTPSEKADQLQADYFLRLLVQNRHLVDHRIDEYRKAIASAQASGNAEGVCGLRRMASIEEQERDTLNDLIESLHRRFPGRGAAEVVAPQPGKARLVAR